MRKMHSKIVTFSLAAVALLAAATAQAAPVQVRDRAGGENGDGSTPGNFQAGTGSFMMGTYTGGAFESLEVGTYALEMNHGEDWVDLYTFCMEPADPIPFAFNPFDLVGAPYDTAPITDNPRFTAGEELLIERLWFNALADTMTSPVKAAAFQAIVWEFWGDNTADFTAGNTRLDETDAFTSQVILQAQVYLDNAANVWTDATDLVALSHPDWQDYLMPIAIPEPGTLALVMLAGYLTIQNRNRRRV